MSFTKASVRCIISQLEPMCTRASCKTSDCNSTMLFPKAALLALAALLAVLAASPGDNLDDFQDCLYQCHNLVCFHNPYHILQAEYGEILQRKGHEMHRYEPNWHFDARVAPHLKLLLWDCKSNCDYQCQRIITRERVQQGEEVLQFHGKWPFLRVLGIQELASVVFSMANFVPHYLGYRKLSRAMRDNGASKPELRRSFRNVKFMAFVTMCAWVFSTIFHIRDFIFTERLDYYFAGLTVLLGFYGIGYRYFKLYLPERRLALWLFTSACIAAYAGHVYRLVSDWLYTYNMRANIFVGVLQNVVWCLSCFALYTKYYERENGDEKVIALTHLNYVDPKRVILGTFYTKSAKLYSLYPLLLCLIVVLGMLLEVFDFSPIFYDLVDAHSLWHLVTVVPAFCGWYDWMIWDINENVWGELAAAKEKKEQ